MGSLFDDPGSHRVLDGLQTGFPLGRTFSRAEVDPDVHRDVVFVVILVVVVVVIVVVIIVNVDIVKDI